jgi:peroxiredoxin
VQKLKDKPFVVIGVNLNAYDSKKLKEVMEQEKLPWRSFTDPEGTIADKWNPTTPTFYIIDHRGVIQSKWTEAPGEKDLDAALEKALHAAEEGGKK